MTEIISAVVAISAITLGGYADGKTDSGIGVKGFHEGHSKDKWHFWSRVQAWSGAIGWLSPIFYPLWWLSFLLPIGAILFWIFFRIAVYSNGKWGHWYSSEEGIKGFFGRILVKILDRGEID